MHTDWILTGRSEWAVYSRRLPGRGQGKTQVELEVSKLGGEIGSLTETVEIVEINYLGKRL